MQDAARGAEDSYGVTHIPTELASTPYTMYMSAVNRIPVSATSLPAPPQPFAPNPIYAHLLQHLPAPAPPSLHYRNAGRVDPASAGNSAPGPVLGMDQPAPTSAVLSPHNVDLTERPDVTARASEAAPVHLRESRPSAPGRSNLPSDRDRRTFVGSGSAQASQDNSRYASLLAKRSKSPQINETHQRAVPYLSAAQLYKSLPLSAEIQECEQRLQNMTRSNSVGPGQSLTRSANVSGSIYSTLARSYNSDAYARGGGLSSSGRYAPQVATNRSVDSYINTGVAPRWAQHKYT